MIFEINGIADIMRGSSQASETLGAQELKNQWGTLRLEARSKAVARFARDCLRITAEISVNKFGIDTISQMTGLNYPGFQEKQQAQQALQAQQAQVQAQMQMAQAQGIQPPGPPPQPDPHLLQIAQSPAWEEILALLQNDLQRSYRIDIETNSTVDIEATEDKKDLSEVLQAISQFLSSIGPLVQNGSMPFDMAEVHVAGDHPAFPLLATSWKSRSRARSRPNRRRTLKWRRRPNKSRPKWTNWQRTRLPSSSMSKSNRWNWLLRRRNSNWSRSSPSAKCRWSSITRLASSIKVPKLTWTRSRTLTAWRKAAEPA